MDPRTRIGLLACAGVLAVALDRPASLGVLAAACAGALALQRVEARMWRRGLLVALTIVWSTSMSQGLFYAAQPRVPLVSLGGLHLYREGVLYGMAQSLRFVGLSLAGIALAVSTPPDRMYAALLRLRVPFGLALMAVTALRLLPEIGRDVMVVRAARARRGRPAWRRSPVAWLSLEIGLMRPVVARCWRRAQNLAESLDARGFDPVAPRVERRPLRMEGGDVAVLAAAGALTGAVVGARLLYALYTTDSWYHPALRPLYSFVRGWL